eukprot:7386247-Prymnesium_polylepis.1
MGQYLAPPATNTLVSPAQQRYGQENSFSGLIEPAANSLTWAKMGFVPPSRVVGEKSSHGSEPGNSRFSSSLSAANWLIPALAASSAEAVGTRGIASSMEAPHSSRHLRSTLDSGGAPYRATFCRPSLILPASVVALLILALEQTRHHQLEHLDRSLELIRIAIAEHL